MKQAQFWMVRIGSIAAAILLAYGIEMMASSSALATNPFLNPRMLCLAGMFVTMSVSLNLINGITGQFSIGHFGFMMVGAYTAAVVSRDFFSISHLPPGQWAIVTTLCGGVMAGLAGLIVGIPSLRLRGDYLAIVTLGFGEMIRLFVTTQPQLGGAYGLNLKPEVRSPMLMWLLAMLAIAVCRNMLRTAHGLPFLAIREDEVASNAMGVNTTKYKVAAFVLGSAFAGMAGALYGHTESFINPSSFTMENSFLILTMVVLGGSGSITGSALAAVALFYLPEVLKGGQKLPAPVAFGLLCFAFVLTAWAKRAQDKHFAKSSGKRAHLLAGIGVSAGVTLGASLALSLVPQIAQTSYEVNRFRMVIFAVTLVIMMLLRPQGILGHREFSWDLFSKKEGRTV